MVVSHTLEGQRVPISLKDLFVEIPVSNRLRLTIKKLKDCFESRANELGYKLLFENEEPLPPPRVPFLRQRFMGVR